MKNHLLFLCAIGAACFGFGQSPESFRAFLNATPADNTIAVAELSLKDQMIRFPTDDKSRHRVDGSLGVCVYLRKKYEPSFQPHLLIRVRGHLWPSYYSTQVGFGYTHRQDGYSLGFYAGKYERQVLFGGDIVYRHNREYESRPLFGGYVHFDPKAIGFFGSLTQEYKRVCHFARLDFKPGDLVSLPKSLRGVRVSAESEYLVGTSLSLSVHYSHVSMSLAYHLPKEQEETYQKSTAPRVQQGYSFGMSYRWF